MPLDWNAEVVDQIETHWRQQLRPRWDGLTDDEYLWQPVPGCWTLSERGHSTAPVSLGGGASTWDYGGPDAHQPVTTIAWRMAHLAVGLAETNASRFGGARADIESFHYAGTAGQALEQIDAAFDDWLDGIKRLGHDGLAAAQGPTSPPAFADAPVVRLILFQSVELIHHGAEVCLLRDLYAARHASTSARDRSTTAATRPGR